MVASTGSVSDIRYEIISSIFVTLSYAKDHAFVKANGEVDLVIIYPQVDESNHSGTLSSAAAMAAATATASPRRRVMVTFDIDGTLIRSTGLAAVRLHHRAFAHAFRQVLGLQDATIDVIQHHGQTDPLILVNTLVHYGIPSDLAHEKLSDMKSMMVDYAKEHASEVGEGLEVLPGVASLLDILSSKGVVFGLVTGNLQEIAWMKMEGLGLKQYFTVPNFGGFGSDHIERGELVKIAASRAEELYHGGFELRVHVGDTPNDVKAAEYGGALAVGVCTGIFTEQQLKEASSGNAVILPDLTDTKAFLKLLDLDD